MSTVPENTADGRRLDPSDSRFDQSGPRDAGGSKKDKVQDAAKAAGRRASPLIALWKKINNDWAFNWSSGLAYTFLTSILPIFLAILGIAGFVLGAISPASLTQLENTLARSFPGGANGLGGQLVTAALRQLHHSAGIFLIVGILGAIIAGSGLFLSLESAFGIVFRVKGRNPIPQRIMAVSMVLFYVVLVPLMVLASILPAAILHALAIGTGSTAGAFLIQALGLLVALASSILFFGAIYFVVPNRRMSFGEIWKGTLLAAALLVLYEIVFPIYVSLFLHPNNYGSLVGFAILLLTFFYYLAFIVLLGAEVNSTAIGLRPTTQSLSGLLQELQARDELIEPPKETAGQEH
jgi:membrane protein